MMSSFKLLICATKPEWGEIKKTIPFQKSEHPSGATHHMPVPPLYEAEISVDQTTQSLKLCQIGIGPKRATSYMAPLLNLWRSQLSLVIHFGLSGALVDSLKVGEVFLADRFTHSQQRAFEAEKSMVMQAEKVLQKLGLPYTVGCLLTNPTIIATPEQKRVAGQKFEAMAVDMETYPIASLCKELQIPFLSIRAIFDPIDWDLTDMEKADLISKEGELRTSKLTGCLFKSPKLVMSLPKYQQAGSKGNKAIAVFINEFLKRSFGPQVDI